MKYYYYIFLFISILFCYINITNDKIYNLYISAQNVVVSAIVWNINSAPIIISMNPNTDIKLLQNSEVQNFSIYYQDREKDPITFTITPKDGYVQPINWKILKNEYNYSSWSTFTFTYLAPLQQIWPSNIMVTINDWSNVITKDILLYIY